MRIGYLTIILVLCLCLFTGCALPAGLSFPWDSDRTENTTQPDDSAAPVTDPLPVSDSETTSTVPEETPPESETAETSSTENSVPDETPPEESTVILPLLIGQDIFILDTLLLHRIEVSCIYTPNNAPAGTIIDASFSGSRTETEFHIQPDTTLLLLVSSGSNLENVTVADTDKTVYLTFDDGPSPKHTRTILDILDAYGIKGTFFLVGTSVVKYPELVQEIRDRGHKIGCHSYSHVYADIYESTDNMLSEIDAWEKAVTDALGFLPEERLFRFPGGSTTCKNEEIEPALAETGLRMFDWNMVNNDCLLHTRPEDMTPEEYIKDSVISTYRYSLGLKGSPKILLMHDTYAETAEFLPWIIDYLTEQGCTFDTLDALPGSWLH